MYFYAECPRGNCDQSPCLSNPCQPDEKCIPICKDCLYTCEKKGMLRLFLK